MRKLLLATAAAATIAAVQMPADAAADGFYVGAFGGFGWVQDVQGDYTYVGGPLNANLDVETGYVLGIAGGYKFDFGGRAELEFGFRSNELDKMNYGTGKPSPIDGDINVYSLMTNFWYDFDTGTGLMPYAGGGIGAAWVTSNDWHFPGTPLTHSDDSDTAFAYQLGAGVNYAISETFTLGLGYRFFGTTGFELENTYAGATNYDYDAYYNHSVLLNLIVNFGGIE